MALMIKIDEIAKISNRELIKGIEDMKPEDRIWIIERLNHMDSFSKEIWHFKTSALKLSKRDLQTFEILDLLKQCNKIQIELLRKLKNHETDIT